MSSAASRSMSCAMVLAASIRRASLPRMEPNPVRRTTATQPPPPPTPSPPPLPTPPPPPPPPLLGWSWSELSSSWMISPFAPKGQGGKEVGRASSAISPSHSAAPPLPPSPAPLLLLLLLPLLVCSSTQPAKSTCTRCRRSMSSLISASSMPRASLSCGTLSPDSAASFATACPSTSTASQGMVYSHPVPPPRPPPLPPTDIDMMSPGRASCDVSHCQRPSRYVARPWGLVSSCRSVLMPWQLHKAMVASNPKIVISVNTE